MSQTLSWFASSSPDGLLRDKIPPSKEGKFKSGKKERKEMPTFIPCLNSITLKQAGILDRIRLAGEVGFQQIELWNNEVDEFLERGGTLREIQKALEDNGLKVPNMIALHNWMNTTGEEHRRAIEECKRRMEQAIVLGSPFICASPPMEEVDLNLATANYRELLEIGEQMGIIPALEYLGFVKGVKDIKTAWAIIQGTQHPKACIVMDFFHMYNGGSTVEDLRSIPGAQIAITHLDDAPAGKPPGTLQDADRVWPGDGVIPLGEMCQALIEVGYQGPLSLELFNPQYWALDPEECARLGYEKSLPWFRWGEE